MKRRDFLKKAGVATAGASLSPLMFANAQASTYRFDLVTSWPTSLDTLWGGVENYCRYVSELTAGDVEINPYPAGAQVGAFEVYDAVSSGAFQMAHSAPYYFIDRNPTHGFFTSVPFGLDTIQYNAWMFAGDGQALADELTFPDDVVMIPAGNTGAQTSGWFRREINTVEDLQGLSMRFPGFGGQVMSRIGMNIQNLPGGELYLALETGVIDAADWVGPYDDEILGLNEVAPYYYLPSWAEPGPGVAAYVNKSVHDDLPADIQAALRAAGFRVNNEMQALYEARNGEALARMVAGGTQVRILSDEILAALAQAANEIHEENAAGSELYARVLENHNAFKDVIRGWHRGSQFAYSSFVQREATQED